MKKLAMRRYSFSMKESSVLKKKAYGKPMCELGHSDFKKSFVKMFWSKFSGVEKIVSVDEKVLSTQELHDFCSAMFR